MLTRSRFLPPVAVLAGALLVDLAACGTDNGRPDPLEEVDATTTTTTKKDSGTSSAGDSGATVEVDSGVEDSGPPPDSGTCYDPGDPGGSESTAKDLPNIDDCDGSGGTKTGVAAGVVDTDFYHFKASDTFLCTISPTASSKTAGLELCMFSKCQTGTSTDFQGCTQGTEKTSSLGVKGCCVNTPGTLAYDYNCNGTTDEAADVFIRVKGTTDACQVYSFSYNF